MNHLDLLKLTAARTLDLTFEHSDQPEAFAGAGGIGPLASLFMDYGKRMK